MAGKPSPTWIAKNIQMNLLNYGNPEILRPFYRRLFFSSTAVSWGLSPLFYRPSRAWYVSAENGESLGRVAAKENEGPRVLKALRKCWGWEATTGNRQCSAKISTFIFNIQAYNSLRVRKRKKHCRPLFKENFKLTPSQPSHWYSQEDQEHSKSKTTIKNVCFR